MTEKRTAFKEYFDREAARALADQVAPHAPGFDRARFLRRATQGLDALEMMDRVRQFSDALRAELPGDTAEALATLTASLPPPLPDCEQVTDGYLQWPLGQLIADHGTGDPDAAMDAMIALTQRFSAEFAVRPFLLDDPRGICARLLELTSHPSPHVRRWCSEGTRPRLPWGARARALVRDPSPILPILEALKDDPEEYVRRSVANNLNDIAKDHPELVLATAERWCKGAPPDRQRLVRHALRTLIKKGDPRALAVLGYGPATALSATLSVAPKTVAIGERITLTLDLHNGAADPQALLVDYRIHYRKANGETRPKVFKWKELRLDGDASLQLTKRLAMRVATIRPLYVGDHPVDVMVNGEVVASDRFELSAAPR